MIAKVYEIDYRTIVAVCDKEHLGKEYSDGKLNFRVSEKFFGGKEISDEELVNLVRVADTVNAFGNKCTGILQREGLISENSVILIKGIKHAQLYKV